MYNIVAIEREYASGGNEIGKRLAKELGYKLYDRNIMVEAAKKLAVPACYLEELEESGSGSVLFNLSRTALGGLNKDEDNLPLTERLYVEEKKIVRRIVEEDRCVIVGRAASYILRDRIDCLKVFIHADKDSRIQRAVEHEGIKPVEVEAYLKKYDKRRRSFYETNTKWEWGSRENFEVCLDSGKLGIDACVRMLAAAVKIPE